MNRDELATLLDGGMYRNEIDRATETQAKAAGLVVVFGASDDLIEFRGAIHDEEGAYGGTEVAITRDGLMKSKCDQEDCPYFEELQTEAATIEALWCAVKDGPTWTYKTDIPHSTFDIQSDDAEEGIYCRGIVFALTDIDVTR